MVSAHILIVDDEQGMLEVCSESLSPLDHASIVTEADSTQALRMLEEQSWDLLLLDINMPGIDGVELLRRARAANPQLPVIMLTGFPSVETAVATMKLGAHDYITKPFIPDDLYLKARRALESCRIREEHQFLSLQIEGVTRFGELIGGSEVMRRLFEAIDRVAPSDTDVLISGESGTGKELVARSLHDRSGRRGRFVPIDCGAIPETLFEVELFGHERGAFTGADKRSPGLLEFANGGTLFLDEVGELPLLMQAKLLRTLQERHYRRVGGREQLPVDLRVIAATNRDLSEAMRTSSFREDLFYRLSVVPITVPPLRERPRDIPLLFDHFLKRHGSDAVEVDPALPQALSGYAWPGNVRQLQSLVRRMLVMCAGDRLSVMDLPQEFLLDSPAGPRESGDGPEPPGEFFSLRSRRIEEFEREYIREILRKHEGNVTASVAEAGIPRATFYRLVKKHDITPAIFRRDLTEGE